jgi:hypothetical protein
MNRKQFFLARSSSSREIFVSVDAISRVDIAEGGKVTVFVGGDEGLVVDDKMRSDAVIDWVRAKASDLLV